MRQLLNRTRHYRVLRKKAQTAKTGMIWAANHDMVKNFNLEKSASSNEVTGDFDVGLGSCRITALMIAAALGMMAKRNTSLLAQVVTQEGV